MLILILIIIVFVAYLFFRKAPDSYFLTVSFKWEDIYKVFGLTDEEKEILKINKDFLYKSPNAHDGRSLGIDEINATFEYYVTPNALGNRSYRWSSIYDQQLKRFFETPNTAYGTVLSGEKDGKSLYTTCLFNKSLYKGNSAFSIYFSNTDEKGTELYSNTLTKILIVLFDDKYLNLMGASKKWTEELSFKTYLILKPVGNSEAVTEEITMEKGKMYVSISPQSAQDAMASPISKYLYDYFKTKKAEK
jgi:hypothetical protein